MIEPSRSPEVGTHWGELARQVLDGKKIDRETALSILRCPDPELLDLLAAAYRIRHRYFQNTVQLYFLMNAKSGLCPEDCGYCSQSKVSEAAIPRYNLLDDERLMEGAQLAADRGSKTFCIVISARGPTEREIEAVCRVVPRIRERFGLEICACLGLLSDEQAQRLKQAGVDKVNHNLNTSQDYYASICTTHGYAERVATLRAVRAAGMELCSGGIVGMGETDGDVVDMAFALRDLAVESIPVNFFNAIPGTPLAGIHRLNPRYCLKVLCLFRFANPSREIRIAGGREIHLGSLQPLGLYPANSMFVGDYLTTKGQAAERDYQMIEELGFVVTGGTPRPNQAAAALEVIGGANAGSIARI